MVASPQQFSAPGAPDPAWRASLRPLTREELAVDPLTAAHRLLNAVLVVGDRIGRIVEVEAYDGGRDPASHAYRGPTARNATMFGKPGCLYVYLSYGIHTCANVVCRQEGEAGAVLLRAVTPLAGIAAMRAATPVDLADHLLGSGPGRLCRALGITRADDGSDLVVTHSPVRLYRDRLPSPRSPLVGPRVGLSKRCGDALHWRWRLAVPGAEGVSRPLPPEARKTRGEVDKPRSVSVQ